MIGVQRRKPISLAGLVGAAIIVGGLAYFALADVLAGTAIMIFGFLVGRFGGPEYLVMVCPQCGYEHSRIDV